MRTALYDLAHAGDVERIRLWLDENPDDLNLNVGDGYTLLHVACLFGHEKLVRLLLERGALVNINADNDSSATPLHAAVAFRDEAVAERLVEFLVANGAELNSPQRGGQTALHHAVGRSSQRLTHRLIQLGADPHLRDEAGRSAGDIAKTIGGEIGETLSTELRQAHALALE